MEIKEMSVEELMERRAAIAVEVEAEDADLDALEAEARSIKEELEARKAEEAKRAEIRSAVANGAGTVIKSFEEEIPVNEKEIRNSAEYINAYANYIKTGDDTECRSLLTTNVSGGKVAVPDMVLERVQTAWNREGIMRRVKKAYIKGNLKVGFELSSTGAGIHTEGATTGAGFVNEETLVLGTVSIVPQSIKKWITISDEVLDMRAPEFLQYVYDELTYQIAKKAADELVGKIISAGTASTATAVGVPAITVASIGLDTVAQAIANLADEATEPILIMNKLTYASFKAAQAAGNYGYDPFEGLPVEFNSTVTAYSAATTGVPYLIVGDLANGAIANFPSGEEIEFKFDDLSLAEKDLVKIVGRKFVGLGIVGPGHFCKVTK